MRDFIKALFSAIFNITFTGTVLLCLYTFAFSLNPSKEVSQYAQEVWGVEDGLPQNSVQAIVQTQDQYIWVGTMNGLARFDGVKFHVFNKQNTKELKSNNIKVLFEDSRGGLWIGTQNGGLTRYSEGKFNTYTTANNLPSNTIFSIAESRDGIIWIGTWFGLTQFKDGQFKTYTVEDGLAHNGVYAIAPDHEQNLWIGTNNGLSKFKDGKFSNYFVNHKPSHLIRYIYVDNQNAVWIAAHGAGLIKFHNNQFTHWVDSDGLVSNVTRSICEDRDGNLWIGTWKGISRFSKDGIFSNHNSHSGLPGDLITQLLEDKEGNLWIGTKGEGLIKISDNPINLFAKKDGLSDNIIHAVYEDAGGGIWIGTEGGKLNYYRDGIFKVYSPTHFKMSSVWAIAGGANDEIWIGTSNGLLKFEKGQIKLYTGRNHIPREIGSIRTLYLNKAKELWIGSFGLVQYKDDKFITQVTREQISKHSIWTISEGSNQELWIGSTGRLYHFKNDNIKTHDLPSHLSSYSITTIYQDSATLVGTIGGGLLILKNGFLSQDIHNTDLLGSEIYDIFKDDNDDLWITSNNGIYHIDKEKVRALINGHESETIEPLSTIECSKSGNSSGLKSKDGKLYIATIKGLLVIDPKSIKRNQILPPVKIEKIIVDGQPFPSNNIELPSSKNQLEIHYTGISFTNPKRVKFKYKLEGSDNDWVEAGTRRIAHYAYLQPGNYKFKVIACNNDGLWNEVGSSIDIRIKPLFYQTTWFMLLSFLCTGMIGWSLYKLRTKQVAAQYQMILSERNRMARELHDTLAQGFVAVLMQIDSAIERLAPNKEADLLHPAQKYLEVARNMVIHSIAEARRSIWDLRSKSLEKVDLPTSIAEFASNLLVGKEINFNIQVTGDSHNLSSTMEHNLLRICQEAMTNTVKHGHSSQIFVELNFQKHNVMLKISDDGCGFDFDGSLSSLNGRYGLLGMHERTSQLGGTITIKSQADLGTEITVVVPIIS